MSNVFQGFVITDFMGIDMITGPAHANYAYLIEQSVGAGVDMVCWLEYMITKKLIKLYFVFVGCGFLLCKFMADHGWKQLQRIHRRVNLRCEEQSHPNETN